MLGYGPDELTTRMIWGFVVPEPEDGFWQRIEELPTRGRDRFTARLRRKDGTVLNSEISVVCQPGGLLATFLREVPPSAASPGSGTQGLGESHRRFSSFFQSLESCFVLYEVVRDGAGQVDFRCLEVNPAFEALVGGDAGQLVGRTVGQSDPVDAAGHKALLVSALHRERGLHTEFFSPGLGMWLSLHAFQPQPGFVAVLFNDITDRKKMEERLKENERQLKIIFDNTGTANSIFDNQCRLVRQNSVSVAQLGLTEEAARGQDVVQLFGADRGHQVEVRMRRVLAQGASESFDTRFELPSGTKTFRSFYQPLFDDGSVVGVQVVSQDISVQVEAQRALAESELQFRTIFELAADLVCIAGFDGVFRLINPAGQALLKYDEQTLLSRSFLELVVPEDRERTTRLIQETLARGETVVNFENRYLCGDGSIVQLEWVSRPVVERNLIFAVARDVTARRKFEAEQVSIEAQIRKTQKLESLGILAGGIAHDFNNILAGILGFVGLAALRTTDEKMRHYLEKMENGCLRAQALTRQLLTFAKGGAPILKSVELGPLVETAVQFASHGSTARITVDLEPQLPPVACDPEQISQVVSNLVINALQAMDGAGALVVTVGSAPGQVVCRFRDTGPGVPPELQEKIFDPFFTTKNNGTGLGLSICHSVVHNHQGTLTLESTPGSGSTFSFSLPVASGSALREPDRTLTLHRGEGRALVLDDEEAVRASATEILERFGYTAHAVAGSTEFWTEFDNGAGPPRLCLLDLTTPGDQGGVAWASQLRARGYQGLLVAMSGYSQDPVLGHPRDFGFDAGVSKPFRLLDLSLLLESLTGSPGR